MATHQSAHYRTIVPYFFVVSCFLCLLIIRFWQFEAQKPEYTDRQEITASATITSEPKVSGKWQRLSIALRDGTRVYVSLRPFPAYTYGEKINIKGTIERVTLENGHEILTMRYPLIERRENLSVFHVIITGIRHKTTTLFEKTLSPIGSSLLLGIVLGLKKDMPEAFSQDLQEAGLMHVIAASGMNVSMVAGALFGILSQLLSRKKALIGSIGGIFFYAVLSGLEPSIVRASLMATITFSAGMIGRQKTPLYALLLTAFVMLFVNPGFLFDVGFQLSLFATAGILLIKPFFGILTKGSIGSLVGEDIGTTIAAQVATLPILLGSFGSVNVLSIFANALILWTIPILMMLGALALFAGFVFEPLAVPILYLSLPFLMLFESVVRFFGKVALPLTIETLPISLVLGYYFLVTAGILWLSRLNMYKKS